MPARPTGAHPERGFALAREGSVALVREGGFALVIVLWSLVLLTLIGTQLTTTGQAELRLVSNLRGAASAEAAADGLVYATVLRLLAQPESPWPPDPAPRAERLPSAVATVSIGTEDGKFDLNSVSADVLTALLRALGVGTAQAQSLAVDIVLWRFPSPQATARAAAYVREGRSYGPPGASFQSVAELSLVLGITPEINALLRPHVTVHHNGDPDPLAAGPLVRRLLGPQSAAVVPGRRPPGRIAVIEVAVETQTGSRASRRAVVRIGEPVDRGGWRVLTWE